MVSAPKHLLPSQITAITDPRTGQLANEVELVYIRPKKNILPKVNSASEASNILRTLYPEQRIDYKEMGYGLYLNSANQVVAFAQLSIGGLTGTVMDIREIFQLGLKLNATAIIVAHNHPSGNLKPSEVDKIITKKIYEAGNFLDIHLIDHLIITSEGYYSFADEGLL